MARAKITDRDKGAKRLAKALKQSAIVTVGIHEKEGAEAKDPEGGLSLVEVAAVHEFGSEAANIPRRSFIRDWFDETEQKQQERLRKLFDMVAKGGDLETLAKRFGLLCQAEVQARIALGIPPPLEEETIARKGGKSTPLINTGQLRTSITNQVEIKK